MLPSLSEARAMMQHQMQEYRAWLENEFMGREMGADVRRLYIERLRLRAESAQMMYEDLCVSLVGNSNDARRDQRLMAA